MPSTSRGAEKGSLSSSRSSSGSPLRGGEPGTARNTAGHGNWELVGNQSNLRESRRREPGTGREPKHPTGSRSASRTSVGNCSVLGAADDASVALLAKSPHSLCESGDLNSGSAPSCNFQCNAVLRGAARTSSEVGRSTHEDPENATRAHLACLPRVDRGRGPGFRERPRAPFYGCQSLPAFAAR